MLLPLADTLKVASSPEQIVELGNSVTLDGSVTGDGPFQYKWIELNDDQENKLQPTVSPTSDTNYTLLATSNKGCSATDQVSIVVKNKFVIPNAFSPNNDGVNDTWKIENLDVFPDASVQVFNRYGESVFATKDSTVLWDGTYQGKRLPWGTYYYIIDLNNGDKPLNGWVVIFN